MTPQHASQTLFTRWGVVLAAVASLLVLASGDAVLAQEASSQGVTALEVPTGARALGQGRAYVAAGEDIQAVVYNPAALAGRDSLGVTFSRYEGASELDLSGTFGAFSAPLLAGTATVAINYEDLGEFELTGPTPDPLATLDLRNLLLIASYALEVRPTLWLGASAKYLNSDLGVAEGKGVAFDVGARVQPWPNLPLSLGVAVLNVGPDITFEFTDEDVTGGDQEESPGDALPSRLRWGGAVELGELGGPGDYGLRIGADVEHNLRELGEISLFGGLAVDYRDIVVVRGGLLRLDNSFGDEAATGASLGAGVRWHGFGIDIARELGVNDLGDETHFSVGVDF